MNKIICDVCGTAYPETAAQCPICGCVRDNADQTVTVDTSAEDTSYVYTKGGRFSKRNVRRRTQKSTQETRTTAVRKSEEGDEQTNRGLVILVIVLLLAIIAVVIYIGVRFFAPFDSGDKNPVDTVGSTGTSQTQQSTEQEIPCTALEISNKTIEFRLSGDAWLLEAVATPVDTTDAITYTSANDKVAIVSETGCVTAVGGGETMITVTCGEITQQCRIICSFTGAEIPTEGETEAPTEGTTSGPVDTSFEFSFRWADYDKDLGKYDTTITEPGYTWRTYKSTMTVSPDDIVWTSDDPSIAKIEKGIVTAVAPGVTEVHAQYGGKTFTCIVRCMWKAQSTENNEDVEETKGIRISTKDATVKVNESFYLRLIDANDKNIEVQWVASEEGYVTIEGNKITGVKGKLTGITVSTTYEGVTYSSIVRINGE